LSIDLKSESEVGKPLREDLDNIYLLPAGSDTVPILMWHVEARAVPSAV